MIQRITIPYDRSYRLLDLVQHEGHVWLVREASPDGVVLEREEPDPDQLRHYTQAEIEERAWELGRADAAVRDWRERKVIIALFALLIFALVLHADHVPIGWREIVGMLLGALLLLWFMGPPRCVLRRREPRSWYVE